MTNIFSILIFMLFSSTVNPPWILIKIVSLIITPHAVRSCYVIFVFWWWCRKHELSVKIRKSTQCN